MSYRTHAHSILTGRPDGTEFHIRHDNGNTASIWVARGRFNARAMVRTLTCPTGFYVARRAAADLLRSARQSGSAVGAVRYRYVAPPAGLEAAPVPQSTV